LFGLVGYSIASFFIACLLTVIVAMFRPIKQNDDWKAWKWIVGFMVTIGSLPYAYVEGLTAIKGKTMKGAVQEAVHEAELQGELQFYKVVRVADSKAHVIAVSTDENEFGSPERAIMEIDLVQEKGQWHADAYSIVNSFHRQRDATTTPPYW